MVEIKNDFNLKIALPESGFPAVKSVGPLRDASDQPFQLTITVPDEFYAEYEIVWSSSNDKISVDQNGLVSFVGPMPKRPEKVFVKIMAVVLADESVVAKDTIETEIIISGK